MNCRAQDLRCSDFGLPTTTRMGRRPDRTFSLHQQPGDAGSLIEFWIRGRNGRGLPDRESFDAPNLKPWLGCLSIYEAIDGYRDFRNRLDGTATVDLSGEDWQGRLASDVDRQYGTSLLRDLRRVAVWRHPVLESCSICQKPYQTAVRVLLPVTRNGDRVDEVFLALLLREHQA